MRVRSPARTRRRPARPARPPRRRTHKARRTQGRGGGRAVRPSPPPSRRIAATLLAQANAYFNGITTLTGNFMQIGADGRRIGGKLTLAKPGRLRFDYDQPSPAGGGGRRHLRGGARPQAQHPGSLLHRPDAAEIPAAREDRPRPRPHGHRRGERSGRRAHQPGGPGDAGRHLEDPAVLRSRDEDPVAVADHRSAGLRHHGAALEPAEGQERRWQPCSSSITGAPRTRRCSSRSSNRSSRTGSYPPVAPSPAAPPVRQRSVPGRSPPRCRAGTPRPAGPGRGRRGSSTTTVPARVAVPPGQNSPEFNATGTTGRPSRP